MPHGVNGYYYEIMDISSELFDKLFDHGIIVWPTISTYECEFCKKILYVGASLKSCEFIYREYHTNCKHIQKTPLFKALELKS